MFTFDGVFVGKKASGYGEVKEWGQRGHRVEERGQRSYRVKEKGHENQVGIRHHSALQHTLHHRSTSKTPRTSTHSQPLPIRSFPFSFQTNNSTLIKIHKTRHIVSQLLLQLLVIRETPHIFHDLHHPRHDLLHLLPRQRSRHPLHIIARNLAYQIISACEELLQEFFERFFGVPLPHQRHNRELKVGQIILLLLRNHASDLL